MNQLQKGNYSGGCKAMYRTLLEGVWLSDIGRMAEVRNVPHLACSKFAIHFFPAQFYFFGKNLP